MDQELTQEKIDAIINKKLQKLENDYELVKKYDDPNYQPAQPIQSNQEENEQKQEENEQKQEETQQQYNEVEQNKSENDNEDEEFQDYQGYEQLEDGEEQPLKEEEQIDFDAIEHIDPFSKPLDVEKIKQFMSQIELPTPPWAQDPEQWKNKFTTIYKNQ